jgi:hypothetical protein
MNSKNSAIIFKYFSWFVGLYHTILGVIGLFAPQDVVGILASKVFNLSVVITPQFIVTARFSSAYMLALGVTAILMAKKPRERSYLIWPIVILIAVRLYTRIFYASDIHAAFGAGFTDNLRTIIIISVIALGLIIFRPQKVKN